jgi:outer membrane lipoprotein-sorting protein
MSTIGVTTVNGTFVYIYDRELKQQSPQWNPVHSMSVKSKAIIDEHQELLDIF